MFLELIFTANKKGPNIKIHQAGLFPPPYCKAIQLSFSNCDMLIEIWPQSWNPELSRTPPSPFPLQRRHIFIQSMMYRCNQVNWLDTEEAVKTCDDDFVEVFDPIKTWLLFTVMVT